MDHSLGGSVASSQSRKPVRLGIVGVGKIARDQHLPTIAASPDFTLVAAASRNAHVDGVTNYPTIEAMLAAGGLDAVALCQPPKARFEAARAAIEAGLHVLLEKPPGATLAEVEQLRVSAASRNVTLFAAWHARHASGVEAARAWLLDKRVSAVRIDWRENVRHWHPGQDWIFEPGGLGVFDPGINALSIATAILPSFHLERARLTIPSNRQAPIASELKFVLNGGGTVDVGLDSLQTGAQTWDIVVDTDTGRLALREGGAKLDIDGVEQPLPEQAEYRGVYARFAALIASGESDVDIAPLRHVADAFMSGEHVIGPAFDW